MRLRRRHGGRRRTDPAFRLRQGFGVTSPLTRRPAMSNSPSVFSVIARSEATRQSILPSCSKLDCFASLAMTVDTASRSRGRFCPKFCISLALENRGRREDGVLAAPAVPQAVAKEICCLRAYRFSGEPPAFPAQWLYGLYEIVLVTLLFVTPSPCEALASSRVDACIGASDPNDFTVRNDSVRLRCHRVHRISPHVRDDRERPSHRGRQAELNN